MDEYYFITFESTNHALSAEDFLKRSGYSITVIPTPREVTKSCGLSIKFNDSFNDSVKEAMNRGDIKVKAIFLSKKEEKLRRIEKIG